MQLANLSNLRSHDEIKFVIGTIEDYEWAKDMIKKHYVKVIITFFPVFGTIEPKGMVEWIIRDKLDIHFQLQLHKLVWDENERGV